MQSLLTEEELDYFDLIFGKEEEPVEYDEPVLPDDYPVHYGYYYISRGKVVQSEIDGTVEDLKMYLQTDEIRRCDAVGRDLPLI